MTDIIQKLDYILKEDKESYLNLASKSKIIGFLDQNRKKTDKFGGKVRVSTSGQRWAFGYGGGQDLHFLQASLTSKGWKVTGGTGVGKVSKSTLTDDEMLKVVKAIFDKAEEKK